MANELATLDAQKIKALVATLPTEKRPAMAAALKAAAKHVKTVYGSFDRAFPLACAMVENARLLGIEAEPLVSPNGKGLDGIISIQTWASLGCDASLRKAAIKLRNTTEEDLQKRFEKFRKASKLPTLFGEPPTGEGEDCLATKFTGETEWYTPERYIEAVRSTLGAIDFDPASNDYAQEIVGASEYCTAEENGLEQEWSGRVFLNPPYKMPLVELFVFKLCDEYEAGKVKSAVLLTNNATDPKWWQRAAAMAARICFTSGRISFYNHDGEHSSPTNGQTFMYFGKSASKFDKAFQDVGVIR